MRFKQLSLVALGGLALSAGLKAETINYYVISQQAQPFQIEEQGSNHSGIVTDIVKAVFDGSDYELAYHTYPFNRMITVLEAGGEENWVTYGSPNWGSVQAENLSDKPIYTVRHTLVTSTKSPFNFADMSSLNGKGVVLLHGFDYPELIPYIEKGDVAEIRVKNYQSAFRVIQRTAGEAAFVEMSSRVSYNLDKLQLDRDLYRMEPFSLVIPDYYIHLAFSKQMKPEIQDFINDRLEEMRTSGELDDIIGNYI
ncbi:ABC transporter substrate-binding protein [Vibrio sp. SCSIO 43135]|uniref:substrate-binding periplasmic protein n=1 Tax=Vibrio sp. SCSIO 43135 TaxID=2819096 RepID=UPI0020756A57|nr:ABC transporter substrate-binding protein [Vibrio sp. SCSIO 43135]USD42369.1 ABC transporter substrate-binding protein [Vibrio sp. SCSIO 43135]